MQSWLKERNWVGKCAPATGMTASLRILSSKADSKTWESFTRSELKLESEHQESPHSDIFRKRATKPLVKQKPCQKHLTWAKEKITKLLLSGPKSSFQMKVNFAFQLEIKVPESRARVERHRIHVAWSPVLSFHSQWWFGCHVICWCWSTVFSEVHRQRSIYQDILEHSILPSADKLYGDADFIFQQDLALAHTAKGTKSWFNDHGVTVLDWSVNSPDLNPLDNLWGIVKRKMRDTRPNNADDLKAAIKATWASITPEHRLIAFMPRHFFYWSYVIFKFSETLNLGFSLSVSHNNQNFKK